MNITSSFCSVTRAVIQIYPDSEAGSVEIGNRHAPKLAAHVILPNISGTLSCPLNYFQESASLKHRWIIDDNGQKRELAHLDKLIELAITVIDASQEFECALAVDVKAHLLRYFEADMVHNESRFQGFDCYAFVSLVSNSAYLPAAPPFEYEERRPQAGDFVVVTSDANLPGSIKHWALCLQDDLYISKFGRSGEGSQALVSVTNGKAMKDLYDCCNVLVAKRNDYAAPWQWPDSYSC